MAVWNKVIHINQEEIPQEMFGKVYDWFDFDVMGHGSIEDQTPLWLGLSEDGRAGTCVVIADLDVINDEGKQRLVNFLKCITLNEKFLPFKYDLLLAKHKYNVDMKVVNSFPSYEGIRI